MRLVLLALLGGALLAIPSPAAGEQPPSFHGSWDKEGILDFHGFLMAARYGGDYTQQWSRMESVPAADTIDGLPRPARHGPYTSRLILRDGDLYCCSSSPSERMEFTWHPGDEVNGSEWFYGISLLFPKDWVAPAGFGMWLQHVQLPYPTSCPPWGPNIGFNMAASAVTVRILGGPCVGGFRQNDPGKSGLHSPPIPVNRGMWNDFIWHIRWSDRPDGLFELWHRDEASSSYSLVWRRDGIYTIKVGAESFRSTATHTGIYRVLEPGQPDSVVYHDGFRRGASFEEVVTYPPSTPAITAPTALFATSASFLVSWRPAGTETPASYDVRRRAAAHAGDFGSEETWLSATTAGKASFVGLPGSTYCFSARARDEIGTVSSWSAEKCTAIPLDDSAATTAGDWAHATESSYFLDTVTRTTEQGATLSVDGVEAKYLALLVTKCPTCGVIQVSWNGAPFAQVSLWAISTVRKKGISLPPFGGVERGTLEIKVVSSGKLVEIDAIGTRRK